MRKSFWINFFLICIGIVIGALVADMTSGIAGLRWLNYGLDFGTETPFVLNLNVLRLTFGLTVRISVSTVIFVVFSILLGRLIIRK